MRRLLRMFFSVVILAALQAHGQNQSFSSVPPDQVSQPSGTSIQPLPEAPSTTHPKSTGAGADVGHGAADIGKGVGKGAGDLAKGTGKGAVDLVTLHPVNAAADIGKGAGEAGGHVAVGVAKGTGKITKGTAKALKKLF